MKIGAILPALNEEGAVAAVVEGIRRAAPDADRLRIVVADNGSVDRTAATAERAGAEVLRVPRRGYGRCCRAAIAHLGDWPEALLFLDADGSCRPSEMTRLLDPLRENRADLVLGCRPKAASMTVPQRIGTRWAVKLVNWRWGTDYRDMGPFRCLTLAAYRRLGLRDQTWGWTIEMQIRATVCGLRTLELPVSWEPRRAGVSKISGTLSGVVRAGGRIVWTVGRLSLQRPGGPSKSPSR